MSPMLGFSTDVIMAIVNESNNPNAAKLMINYMMGMDTKKLCLLLRTLMVYQIQIECLLLSHQLMTHLKFVYLI